MNQIKPFRSIPGAPVVLRDRIVTDGATGTPLLPTDCLTFELTVFDTTKAGSRMVMVALTNLSTSPADIDDGKLYDTLQTDVLLEDGGGYNFRYVIRPGLFTKEGNHVYRYEFKFLTADTALGPQFSRWMERCESILADSF